MRPETILKAVSNKTGISIEDIKSESQKYEIQYARNMYCYCCQELRPYLSASVKKIMLLINRKHSTFYNAVSTMKGFIEVDNVVNSEAVSILRKLIPKNEKVRCNPCKAIFLTV